VKKKKETGCAETPMEVMASQYLGNESTEEVLLRYRELDITPFVRRPCPSKPVKSRRKPEVEKKHIKRNRKK